MRVTAVLGAACCTSGSSASSPYCPSFADDTVLLQTHLQSHLSTSPVVKSVGTGLLRSANAMVKSARLLDTTRRAGDDDSFLLAVDTLREETKSLLLLNDAQHVADTAVCSAQFAEVQACFSTFRPSERAERVRELCIELTACETNRAQVENSRTTSCSHWNGQAKIMWDGMVTATQRTPTFREVHAVVGVPDCHTGKCEQEGAEELQSIAEQMQNWVDTNLGTLNTLRAACLQSCGGQCYDCELLRQQVEAAMCFHHYDEGMLDVCYNHEVALYNSVVDSYHISDLDGINTITAQTYLIFTQLLCILDLVEKAVPGTPLSDDDMAECAPSTLKDDPDIAAKLIELDIPRQTPPPTPIVVVINCLATQPDCLAETQAISEAQDAEFTEGGAPCVATVDCSGHGVTTDSDSTDGCACACDEGFEGEDCATSSEAVSFDSTCAANYDKMTGNRYFGVRPTAVVKDGGGHSCDLGHDGLGRKPGYVHPDGFFIFAWYDAGHLKMINASNGWSRNQHTQETKDNTRVLTDDWVACNWVAAIGRNYGQTACKRHLIEDYPASGFPAIECDLCR